MDRIMRRLISASKQKLFMFNSFYSNKIKYYTNEKGVNISRYLLNFNVRKYSAAGQVFAIDKAKIEFNEIVNKDWAKCSPKELFAILPEMKAYCSKHNVSITDTMFDEYIDNLADNITHASDEELQELLNTLIRWPLVTHAKTRNFIEIWVSIDDACFKRIPDWTWDQRFQVMTLFKLLQVARISDFIIRCIEKFSSSAKNMTKNHFVQGMFLIGVIKKPPVDMHNCEVHLNNIINTLNEEELATIARGFYKCDKSIKNYHIVKKMIKVLLENSQTLSQHSVSNLVNCIRRSMKKYDERIYDLLNVLQYEVPRLHATVNIYIALLGSDSSVLHKDCFNAIADNIYDDVENLKIDFLDKILEAFSKLNFLPQTKQDLIGKIYKELKKPARQHEYNVHASNFIKCVVHLTHLNIYDIELMEKVLDPVYLKKLSKRSFNYPREVLVVNNCAELFFKDTRLNKLSDKDCVVSAKRYTLYIPDANFKSKFNLKEQSYLDVCSFLKEERGDLCVTGDHILPHYEWGDIIICNDNEGKPVEVTNAFDQAKFGLIRPPPDNNTWIVLVIGSNNDYINCNNDLGGILSAKSRELHKLGYKVAMVSLFQFCGFETNEDKKLYLNKLINEAIE